MRDRGLHSGRRGDVPSAWVPTASWMILQCPGWQHRGGDGRTGPEVMEEMWSIILASRRRPGLAPGWWPYVFRGCHCPLSRGVMWTRYGSGWQSVKK
jgi:hypothetical protein